MHFGQKDKDGVIILYRRRGLLQTAKRRIKEVPSRMPELRIKILRKVVNYGIFIKQRINQGGRQYPIYKYRMVRFIMCGNTLKLLILGIYYKYPTL